MSRTVKKAYTKSKKVDKQCRSHGLCPYCQNNRQHKHNKQPSLEEELKQLINYNATWI